MIVTPIKIGRITSSSQSNLQLSLGFIVEREGVEGFIDLTIRERFRTQRTSVVNMVSRNIKDIYANIGFVIIIAIFIIIVVIIIVVIIIMVIITSTSFSRWFYSTLPISYFAFFSKIIIKKELNGEDVVTFNNNMGWCKRNHSWGYQYLLLSGLIVSFR